MHAHVNGSGRSYEMCAYKACCQRATTPVWHEGVEIRYCRKHAIKVLGFDPREMKELEDEQHGQDQTT